MNQKHQPRTDAMSELESPETSARLDAFERRLKATRPTAGQLDAVALQELAQGRAIDAMLDLPPRRKASNAMMIAGSWVFGVAVGAVVMFILMSNIAPGDTTTDESTIVRSKQETPTVIAEDLANDVLPKAASELPDESAIVTSDEPRRTNETTLTKAFSSFERPASAYLNDGPTLHAGTHLRRGSAAMSWPFAMIVESKETDDADGDHHSSESRSTPMQFEEHRSPTSRRELMREFLGEPSEAVL